MGEEALKKRTGYIILISIIFIILILAIFFIARSFNSDENNPPISPREFAPSGLIEGDQQQEFPDSIPAPPMPDDSEVSDLFEEGR